MTKEISRREFMKKAATKSIGIGLGLSAAKTSRLFSEQKGIPRRKIGKRGLEITILGLGCVAIGHGPHTIAEGADIVNACIDAGVNYIDCASSYGNAEVKVGEMMKSRRREVVLTTKTLERAKEAAWEEINRSLDRLKTDYVDLLQIHSINSREQLDEITRKDGSLA